MSSPSAHDPSTPGERIRWARERAGYTLNDLGDRIGCSHVALSKWETGKTDAASIKASLLQAFADVTGCDVRWLLTGEGPRISRYVLTAEVQRVAEALQVMERTAPQQVETVVRMVEAAAKTTK